MNLKNRLRLSWGRAWRIRSKLLSSTEKQAAYNFLTEHQDNMLFVFGTGRSGTQLVSDLLLRSGVEAVFHEPNFKEDVGTMEALRGDTELTERYWKEFRCLAVYRRWLDSPQPSTYCEVNGTIRYQIPTIKHLFPNAKMFLLSRDGRGVVRSVMGWPEFYGDSSKGAYAIAPFPEDPFFSAWEKMSRFEKLCWSWRDSNEILMKYIPKSHRIQLERLTTDYDYFTQDFARLIDRAVPFDDWHASVSRLSRNASQKYSFPSVDEWSDEHKRTFVRICGDVMTKLGYEI